MRTACECTADAVGVQIRGRDNIMTVRAAV